MPTIVTGLVVAVLAGCASPGIDQQPLGKDRELLTVDFQQDQILRYRFVSSRKVRLDWSSEQGKDKTGMGSTVSSEQMEMVVEYAPVEVQPFGLTTIKATIESVTAKRTGRQGNQLRDSKDAVRSLAGKSFTFKIAPSGTIKDYSQLEALIKQAGEKAFRANTRYGRIKEPDMIGDFITSQWFLWDSVASIKKPTDGVAVGQSWQSQLSLPTPMLMREARDVTYTFDEVQQNEDGRIAVISSSFSHAESIKNNWANPYAAGSFQISGPFGLLRRFKIAQFKGKGRELFNIDKGRIEQYNHQYDMMVTASLMLPLPGAEPQITIEQKLTMKLLNN